MSPPSSLIFDDCVKLTSGNTYATLDTFFGINGMRSTDRTCDRTDGTFSCAGGTALTFVSDDLIFHEVLASVSRASLVHNVSDIFIAEETECGKNGVGRGLTERAERSRFDVFAEFFELSDVFHRAIAVCDLFESFEKSHRTNAAGYALTAGFVNGEFKEELRNVNHAVVFVHNDQTAGAHHGADCGEVIVVDGSVDEGSGDTAAGRTAGLSSFELLAAGNAAADFFNDFSEGGTHGDFNETGVGDLTAECEYLGTLGGCGTHGGEPFGSVEDDLCDICESFYVIDDGGLAEKTFYSGERRTGTGFAAVTFDRGEKSGFFAANECACAETESDLEVEAGAEDVVAENAVFFSLLDCDFETVNGDRVFCTNVDVTFVSADCVTCDSHCFENCVGVTFENGTVHECAGVAFVRITYDVFLACGLCFGEGPLSACGEACAAASADAGIKNGLDNFLGSHGGERLCESLVAVACYVFVDAFGIDNAAVTECNAVLLCIEGSLVESEDVVALYGFAVKELANGVTANEVFGNDFVHIFGLNLAVEGTFGINDHDRTECAKTETTGGNDLDFVCDACDFKLFYESFTNVHGVRGGTTRTAANEDVFADAVTCVNSVAVTETHSNGGSVFIFQCGQLFNIVDHIFGFPFHLFQIKDICG